MDMEYFYDGWKRKFGLFYGAEGVYLVSTGRRRHTHPTMLRPFSMKDASVGRFPLTISSKRTPKL